MIRSWLGASAHTPGFPVSQFPRAQRGTLHVRRRIVYVIGQLGPGGSEQQLYYLLETMDRERYRPALAVWNHAVSDAFVSQVRMLGVPVYAFPVAASRAGKLLALHRLLRVLKPEIVHSYSFFLNLAVHCAAQGTAAVTFGSVRGDFASDRQNAGTWPGSLSAHWPRYQICNSYHAAEKIHNCRGFLVPRRLFVVRNGLNLRRFPNRRLKSSAKPVIVGVGSLVPVKRWDRLLAAAAALKRRGFGCVVRIAGDGPLRGSLQQKVDELGVADRAELLGHVADIPQLLSGAMFLVHTSDSEGCPNVIMEAMACARAVIATDVGDVPSLVAHGKTGFVVPRGNEGVLIERMIELLTDPKLCGRMGKAGRAKAEREFGPERLVTATLAAYRAAGWQEAE